MSDASSVASPSEQSQSRELTEPDPPRLDVVFGVLRNSRRRAVLRYLEDEGATTIGDLAVYIAALENDIPEAAVRSKQRKRVYVSLYQSHLPKLDEAGAVSYDSDRGTVEPTADIEEFAGFLESFESTERNATTMRAAYTLTGAVVVGVALGTAALYATGWLTTQHVLGMVLGSAACIGMLALWTHRR